MGAMLAQRPANVVDAHPHHVASTVWIPRVVRCAQCGDLAREDVRERVNDDEIMVRYSCSCCRWRTVRHYHESEL